MTKRSEQDIFDELAGLCISPGYVHAAAYLCFRDNMIAYSDELKPEDMQRFFSRERLIRTETSTLIGLMLRGEVDTTLPDSKTLQHYITRTESLLAEMHDAMTQETWSKFTREDLARKDFNPFTEGATLREPIFYGSDSAYPFQYRDFSFTKYGNDADWLVTNKGFSIADAIQAVEAASKALESKAIETLRSMSREPPEKWTALPCLTFTAQDAADKAGLDVAMVERVLDAFTSPSAPCNEQFTALHDFNVFNACPLIRLRDGQYVLFIIYSLMEALYEAPYYWMGADKAYVNTAMKHRGMFTEQLAVDRLTHVFGKGNVLPNIDIFGPKGNKLGEIDVLVLFGDRAIVLQAKSKRLTLEARRGNDRQLKDDFKKSIQDSSDQAYLCAGLLQQGTYTFRDAAKNTLSLPHQFKRIYVLCLVSDHYPALSFQAQQLLDFKPTKTVSPPFVMDVFVLDAMTEMLNSPLHLLSYIDRRTGYNEKLSSSHELTVLSYHLQQNLWLNQKHTMVMLDDSISVDLDLAMQVRRVGIRGKDTPDGILTRFAETSLGRLTKTIEASPDPATIALGFTLLTINEDTVNAISQGIDRAAKLAAADGKNHDFTAGLGPGETGLIIHCNSDPQEVSEPRLADHCLKRKYTERAKTWFGVCIHPDQTLRFGLNFDFPWRHDKEMDAQTKAMRKVPGVRTAKALRAPAPPKIGRNEPCPCGSGNKYKRCCLP